MMSKKTTAFHFTQVLQNSPDESLKLATANIALHSVFTQMSELSLNNLRRIPQACIDIF